MRIGRRIIVPTETWFGNSPELMKKGIVADVGAVAEALVYYDQVHVITPSKEQFYALFRWLRESGEQDAFLTLMEQGDVFFYHYDFYVNPIHIPDSDSFVLMNVQEDPEHRWRRFGQQVVGGDMDRFFNTQKRLKRFQNAIENGTTVVSAEQFGSAVKNAENYLTDQQAAAHLIQSLFDSLLAAGYLDQPIQVDTRLIEDRFGKQRVHVNVDFSAVGRVLGKDLYFGKHTPVAMAACANRWLWSAAMMNADLYVSQPTFGFLCNQLDGAIQHFRGTKENLRRLAEVDFPDIRYEVNSGRLGARDIMSLRDNSTEFRNWFHDRTEHDRDIIVAYMHDHVNRSGLSKRTQKTLHIAIAVATTAAFTAAGAAIGGTTGAMFGACGGKAADLFLSDIYIRLMGDWRPELFGNEIKRLE